MSRTNKRKRPPAGRTRQQAKGLSGDVPPRQLVDVQTSSVAIPRPTGQLSFRQLAPLQTFQVTAGATGAPVITFALNGVAGSGTLSSLFDLYRIDAIRVTVRPNNNAVALADPTVTALVPLYWVIDYDDAVPLTSASAATEYDNCLTLSPGESASRTLCPMYQLVARSSAGTDYIADRGQWLNTSSDDILHYGVKFFIPAGNALQTFLQTWLVEIEYYFTFRQVS